MKALWKQGYKGEVCVREPSRGESAGARRQALMTGGILTNLHISLNGFIPCPEMHKN